MYRGTFIPRSLKSEVGRVVTLFAAILAISAAPVSAQYGYGYGQYSAGGAPSIIIDKTVAKPAAEKGSTQEFVDNLSPSDPRFSAGQEIFFRLKVKNTSDVKLTNVIVKDELPEHVSFQSGTGDFDSASRTLTIKAGDFEAGEEKEYIIKAAIAASSKLPQDKDLICLINKARVNTSELVDEDTSQFCVEQRFVKGVSEVPATGPTAGLPLFTLYSLAAALGIYIRRRAI